MPATRGGARRDEGARAPVSAATAISGRVTMQSSSPTDVQTGSPDRFGYEWKTYSELRPEYEEQFRRWTPHLDRDDWRGKVILDVGCGMGRNTYWPLTYGAKESVSIDVDENSLASARRTLAQFPNAVVHHMSAYEIGYADHFDIAYSIGVIHHLERPQLALRQMAKAVKPGGRVLVWVYGLENNRWLVSVLDPLRKALFSRLPISVVHHLSLYPSLLLWLMLRAGIGRIEYFNLIRSLPFRHLRSIVFDQMLPKIANYWPRQTVEQLMMDAGLEQVRLAWVNEMSWSAIGEKPASGGRVSA
jgi:SAM-dependent methyltransferase